MTATVPFGAWPSPIAPEDLAAGTVKFELTAIDGDAVWWVESRPDEQGRSVAMRWTATDGAKDVTPSGFSASTTINGYGGAALGVRDGVAWFSNLSKVAHPGTGDLRVHQQVPGEFPMPITPLVKGCYAELVPDPVRGIVFAVHQDPDRPLNGQARQTLVALDMAGKKLPVTLAEGGDFYAFPRLSPCGRKLAWITWDYPSMPWDGTRLQVAELDATGAAISVQTIGGAPASDIDPDLNPVFQNALRYSDESILEPVWGPDGTLFCVSDRLELDAVRWWNIHRVERDDLIPVTRMAAEFASPPWRLGTASYAILGDGTALAAFSKEGLWSLGRVCLTSGEVTPIDTPYSSISHVRAGDGFAVFIGGQFTAPAALVRLDLATGEMTELRNANPGLSDAAQACLPTPEVIDFATGPDGGEKTQTAHAFFYPPTNPKAQAPEQDRPPLIIVIHGGPTGPAGAALSMDIAFFTSRGFAVVDVNYRGSTGFGRAYHQAMYGTWGVTDIEDCVAAARHLVALDKVDRYRIVSRGGSAGGYTTLALATFTDLLSAGASYYGISDLQAIARFTDKLEAHYAELLVGPYPAAQRVFKARSPLFHADEITCPLIIFQGEEDPVVPRAQAQVLIDALMHRGLPVAWEFFPGEGHGFKQKAHIVQSLSEELAFYGKVMGFVPSGSLMEPDIKNLSG
ncbi:alpha/beta hydrolase family protein [Meridianimarinicoccus aquatilis]|uniref:S9 family peptidase n=1 Tax=Meridianimarinicoccus aquatilis TaxID=2552766 RepID=A0A4R6ANT8_9RHOB|nr:prolyl oligopeptidase family serine peptidase [Fluviibacterium aquatile]TDL85165.1 S9 family peptidase [Fluviibacterium aquatile]